MTFPATVVQVLVASPGDTTEAREAILEVAARWNGNHARDRGIVFSPWLYELHGRPELGDRGQAILNRQGVDTADVVVAIFGTTLGSSTGTEPSGTVEEIKHAHSQGKPVHVYFYSGPIPSETDLDKLTEVRSFQDELGNEGFYGKYPDLAALERSVREDLESDIRILEVGPAQAPAPAAQVDLRVRHDAEKEVRGHDKKGKPKFVYTKRALVITNQGEAPAEQLRFKVTTDDDYPLRVDETDKEGWTSPRDLPGHSETATRCVPMRPATATVVVEWSENGQAHTRTFTTQVS